MTARALQQRIWKPELIEYTINAFAVEFRKRMAQLRKHESEVDSRKKRERLSVEKSRLVDAIVANGHSSALLERLRSAETQLEELEAEREQAKSASRDSSFEGLRRFVLDRLSALPQLAASDPERAKALSRSTCQRSF